MSRVETRYTRGRVVPGQIMEACWCWCVRSVSCQRETPHLPSSLPVRLAALHSELSDGIASEWRGSARPLIEVPQAPFTFSPSVTVPLCWINCSERRGRSKRSEKRGIWSLKEREWQDRSTINEKLRRKTKTKWVNVEKKNNLERWMTGKKQRGEIKTCSICICDREIAADFWEVNLPRVSWRQ